MEARLGWERNSGLKFSSLFLGLSETFLDRNNAGIKFFNFLNLFAIFLEFSCPGRVWMEFGTKFFFFSFSAYLILFWLKIMPERGFLIFWIFLLFFWNFLARVEYERNSGLNFFLFLGLSHLVLAKNNARKEVF